ncbi:hypothetical protein [Arthrobacter sp. FW306-04-A]|uniref:hypothetical protein n=1 Tax=Arthrobacter sp. FW306-04-A TaxID=2879619 RepID=UPI0037C0264F|nr:hypothetical protein LFT43_12370 [Arthrobacter sp. FW306-04-A]
MNSEERPGGLTRANPEPTNDTEYTNSVLIIDAAELDALPVGTVVIDSNLERWRKDDDDPQIDDGPVLPASVVRLGVA